MTRRTLVASLLALAGGAWQTRGTAATQHSRALIPAIDTHTHFYDPTRPQGVPWPPHGDELLHRPHMPDEFVPLAAAVGVVGTVVVEASPWLEDNQWLLDLAGAHPVIVGVVGSLSPGADGFASHLARFTKHPLFKGIRLGAGRLRDGLGQAAFDADLRRLEDAGLTLDVLGGPAMLDDVARVTRLAPGLRIVIDHLPFSEWDQDAGAARRALGPFRDRPRVNAKASGTLRRDFAAPADASASRARLDLLYDVFGPERVLFASNWPVSNRMAPYAETRRVFDDHVRTRGLADAERFFWRNSHAVYDWSWRATAPFPGGPLPQSRRPR